MKLEITTLVPFLFGATVLFAQEPTTSIKEIKKDKPTTEVEISEARKVELAKHKKETAKKRSDIEVKKAEVQKKELLSMLKVRHNQKK